MADVDNRPLGERVSSLETEVRLLREAVGSIDEKQDILIAKADEAKGRAETLKLLISGLPSVVWMTTMGGLVGLIAWLWHQLPMTK